MKNKKQAFTMVELIFVIVIIGILAAVAMTRLSATRTDALTSRAMFHLNTCISDMAGDYVATAQNSAKNADACSKMKRCFTVGNGVVPGTVRIFSKTNFSEAPDEDLAYCVEAHRIADGRNMSAPQAAGGRTYAFAGKRVAY